MIIVHVLWKLTTGGAETMVADIANVQANYADVYILTVNQGDNPEYFRHVDKRVKFFCCNRKAGSRNLLPIVLFNMFVWNIHPDVIHFHFSRIQQFLLWKGIKVRTIHNTNEDFGEYALYKECYAISHSVAEEWKQHGYVLPIVMNGINCSAISNDKSSIFTDNKKHFIQVSRLLIKQKGQDILLNALKILHQKRRDFKMHFVGDGPDDALLRQSVIDFGLDDVVVFEGLRDRTWIYDNLCKFDLFIQPSRFEGFGLTVAEACVAKIPVLVSSNEGPLEIIDGGRLGMTFINEDYHDLAYQLEKFMSNGYDSQMIDLAYDRVCSMYDVKCTAEQYIKSYETLLHEN